MAKRYQTAMTPEERFFWKHAGYSYDPKTETKAEGRRRCAVEMAEAESIAQRLQWEFECEYDADPDLSWMSDEEREQEHEVLCCRIVDPKNRRYSLASLCGITDPDANYRRVIEAELACEVIADYDRETELIDAH